MEIIHCDAGLKSLFRLFPITVSFSYISIPQGSVETQLKCGGIFNNCVTANFQENVPVQEFKKKIGQFLVKI